MNVPITGGVFYCFGAALARLRGSAPGPSLLGAERQPSRETPPRPGLRHSEFPHGLQRGVSPRAGQLRPSVCHEPSDPGLCHDPSDPRKSVTTRVTPGSLSRTESPGCLSGNDWSRPDTELGVPKASTWRGLTTRLALRSQQAGARGRAPQARSAAPKQYTTPPQIGTFILCGAPQARSATPNEYNSPTVTGTFILCKAVVLVAEEGNELRLPDHHVAGQRALQIEDGGAERQGQGRIQRPELER